MTYLEPHMVESFKDHVLDEITGFPEGFRCFKMHKPRTGTHRNWIMFMPGRIVITGDTCFGENQCGVVSDSGYGFDWWVSELSERYLCYQFLREKWQAAVVAVWCREMADDIMAGEMDEEFGWVAVSVVCDETNNSPEDLEHGIVNVSGYINPSAPTDDAYGHIDRYLRRLSKAEEFRELARNTYADATPERFCDALLEIGYEVDAFDVPGYDFDLGEAGFLCALQQKFRELWRAGARVAHLLPAPLASMFDPPSTGVRRVWPIDLTPEQIATINRREMEENKCPPHPATA